MRQLDPDATWTNSARNPRAAAAAGIALGVVLAADLDELGALPAAVALASTAVTLASTAVTLASTAVERGTPA